MTHRTLWDQRHEDQSVHEAHSAECTDVSEWPLSASDLWHELYGFDTLRSRNLLAKFWSGRWRIMHYRKSMHGFVGHVHIFFRSIIYVNVMSWRYQTWIYCVLTSPYYEHDTRINHKKNQSNERSAINWFLFLIPINNMVRKTSQSLLFHWVIDLGHLWFRRWSMYGSPSWWDYSLSCFSAYTTTAHTK